MKILKGNKTVGIKLLNSFINIRKSFEAPIGRFITKDNLIFKDKNNRNFIVKEGN